MPVNNMIVLLTERKSLFWSLVKNNVRFYKVTYNYNYQHIISNHCDPIPSSIVLLNFCSCKWQFALHQYLLIAKVGNV